MTIADRIRNKRNELNYSQTELAIKAGYSDKTAISKIENAGDDITMKQVKRIAKALGVQSAYLMGWTNDPDATEEDVLKEAYKESIRNKEFIDLFQSASPDDQERVVNYLKASKHIPDLPHSH